MKVLDSFSQQNINDVLKNVLSISDNSEITFSMDKCTNNEQFILLDVNGNGIKNKYVLVKIQNDEKVPKQQKLENSKVLHPLFTLENNKKETYGAFQGQEELAEYQLPKYNNVNCIKVILRSLADYQASILTSNEKVEKPSEYNVNEVTQAVLSLNNFKDIEEKSIKQALQILQFGANKILKSDLFVKSIGCPLAKNVFVSGDFNQCFFLDVSSTKVVTPIYDALLYIFALSDETFRQQHFEDLVRCYFNYLAQFLQKLPGDLAKNLTSLYIDRHTNFFLPIVKFEIASSFLKLQNSSAIKGVLENISYFLKYPLISQEDIYVVAKNYLGSTHYDLVEYSLKSLSATDGHLGDYFHLNVKVKSKGGEEELQLFVKVLKSVLADLLENGPGKKEDFFYEIFLPLCAERGLGDLLDFGPKCYLSRISRLVVLDDLGQNGYIGMRPNSQLEYEGLRAGVEKLAKFHACSIVLEEILSRESGKTYRLGEDYKTFLAEGPLFNGGLNSEFLKKILLVIFYIVEKFPELTEDLNLSQEEIRNRIEAIFSSYFQQLTKSDSIRRVINHGDMYVANMLFKFGEEKLVTDAMLIDFQMLRYTSPNCDLAVFLFQNTAKETRDKYFKQLTEEYYQHIAGHIKKFDFDPEEVFPKKLFDENIKLAKHVGVIQAFSYSHWMHVDPEFREDMFRDPKKRQYYLMQNKNELVDLSWKSDHYRGVLKGLSEDLIDIIKSQS